jgi:hypothetical protein
MTQIFLSYRFTGENISELKKTLNNITNILEKNEHEVFCSINLEEEFRRKKLTTEEIYSFCTNKLCDTDIFLAFIKSEDPSYGMKLELEKAIELKKKIILIIKKDLDFSEFRKNAEKIIEYDTYKDLLDKIKNI